MFLFMERHPLMMGLVALAAYTAVGLWRTVKLVPADCVHQWRYIRGSEWEERWECVYCGHRRHLPYS